jgi:hypothetical protein
MSSDFPKRIEKHFGIGDPEDAGTPQDLGGSKQRRTVAVMKSRLPAEKDPSVESPGSGVPQSVIDAGKQLDAMAKTNPQWQRQVDQPEDSSKSED